MTTPTDIKTRESRLRRRADRRGLRLIKSHRRDPDAIDYGLYGLIDVRTNGLVHASLLDRYACALSLDEVEQYLIEETSDP